MYISNSNDHHFADEDSSGEESINDVVIEQQVFDRKSREIPVLFSSKDFKDSGELFFYTTGTSKLRLWINGPKILYCKIFGIPRSFWLK